MMTIMKTSQRYTVHKPGRGPADKLVVSLIERQQQGEIAFRLGAIADSTLLGKNTLLTYRSYEA